MFYNGKIKQLFFARQKTRFSRSENESIFSTRFGQSPNAPILGNAQNWEGKNREPGKKRSGFLPAPQFEQVRMGPFWHAIWAFPKCALFGQWPKTGSQNRVFAKRLLGKTTSFPRLECPTQLFARWAKTWEKTSTAILHFFQDLNVQHSFLLLQKPGKNGVITFFPMPEYPANAILFGAQLRLLPPAPNGRFLFFRPPAARAIRGKKN